MQSFKFSNVNVRFFEGGDDVYFITSDANDAFGFKGDGTLLDKLSVKLDTLAEIIISKVSAQNLAKSTLLILLPELIKGIVRSNNANLENLTSIFAQLAAKGFMAARIQKDQPLLPAVSVTDRMANSAISVKRSITDRKKARARSEFMGWNTPRGIVYKLIPAPNKQRTYLNDKKLMWGLRTTLAAELVATTGMKPPTVNSYNCKSRGQGFPPDYEDFAIAYLRAWENGGTPATVQNLLLQSSNQ